MTIRRVVLIALLMSAVIAGIQLSAQAARTPVQPQIIAGPDVGFQLDGIQGSSPVGHLVVRIDGKWVEARFGGAIRPAH